MNKLLIFYFTGMLLIACYPQPPKKIPQPDSKHIHHLDSQETQEPQDVVQRDSSQNKPEKQEKETPGPIEKAFIESGLIDIHILDTTIFVDLKYASSDNFINLNVYGDFNKCYLQPEVAKKFVKAQHFLKKEHPDLSLLVWDAARPQHVQQIFWDSIQKPEHLKHLYVAKPAIGSIHNFGCAVDVTLCDTNGTPLDMGTPFDYFGYKAYPIKEEELLEKGVLTQQQVENRQLLRNIMGQEGFTPTTTEWWHFNSMSRKRANQKYQIIP